MADTPLELYNELLSFSTSSETTICQLHKPCNGHPLCAIPSKTPVIDFDHIEKQLAKGHRPTSPSCDGVTLSSDHSVFCFFEIKGWDKFVSFNIVDAMNPSEAEKTRVKNQAVSYNLKGKLLQSIDDCIIITMQNDLFPKIPYAYIVVTDIDSKKNGIEDIAANLTSLAETSSVWTYCDEIMKDLLNNVEIRIKKVYTHCRDFDSTLSLISV